MKLNKIKNAIIVIMCMFVLSIFTLNASRLMSEDPDIEYVFNSQIESTTIL